MHAILCDFLKLLPGALPFVATLVWATLFRFQHGSCFREWRWSLALACTLLGTFVLALTELLSALHQLNRESVIAAWGLYLLMPLVFLFTKRSVIDVRAEVNRLMSKFKQVPLWMLGGIFVMCGITFLMAVFSPPMNFDVQCYHLPRQVFWLMEKSVRHFDAANSYHNSQPVLSEYLGLNLMLLSWGDAWHNLVQWTYFLGACGIVTLITRSLGGNARGQALAVLFIALVPVVFFQASNSKNDVVLAFFLLIPLLIGIRLWGGEVTTSRSVLMLASLAAGLSMATKGTAIAYLPASALLIVTACFRSRTFKPLLAAMIPGLLLVILPFAPMAIRNISTYHAIGGETSGLLNASHSPERVLGVAMRTVANEFAFGPQENIRVLEAVVRGAMKKGGMDPDDPTTTIQTAQLPDGKFQFFYFAGNEDIIPAPLQSGFCLLVPLFLFFPSFRNRVGIVPLSCVMAGSFLLFCFIFRWQPWGGRLLIPEFFMVAPLFGIAANLIPGWMSVGAVAIAFGFLQQQFLGHGQRHLEGGASIFAQPKSEQMSVGMPGRGREIREIVEFMRQHKVDTVLINGSVSPIYGLLREIRISLPSVSIRSTSGKGDLNGVALLELADECQPSPTGFQTLYSGRYYRMALKLSHP